jgi:hypothetical protein
VKAKTEVMGVAADQDCKTIRQTVTLKDGKTATADVKSCKEAE